MGGEEKSFTIAYTTKDGDVCKVWLYAENKEDAKNQARQEYWDIVDIIQVSED